MFLELFFLICQPFVYKNDIYTVLMMVAVDNLPRFCRDPTMDNKKGPKKSQSSSLRSPLPIKIAFTRDSFFCSFSVAGMVKP